MLCCAYPLVGAGMDPAFTMDASRVTFGRGCLAELGDRAARLGMKRVALFSDERVGALAHFEIAMASLRAAGLDVARFDAVKIEPTSASIEEAARFAAESRADGYVSIGGGSVIDTCKAANLLASHPAPLRTYVNAPVGEGRAPPGPLAPHIACPTTSGTGSEVTGIAIFDDLTLGAKTGIASALLRPSEALVDPTWTASLPREVVAASGLDVLSHAVESFTARPFSERAAPPRATLRPMSQGRNPWSDIGCREALRLVGHYLVRAADDASDVEAREAMMWAATLAGVAFGNAGVHVPHAMAYAIAGLAHETGYRFGGYPEAMVPHGVAVILGAPAVARFTAPSSPERHLEMATLLGTDTRGAGPEDAGEVLAQQLVARMRALSTPHGTADVGYTEAHTAALVEGTLPQARLLANAPIATGAAELTALFAASLRCG